MAARPVQVLYAAGNDAAVQGLAGGERIVLEGPPERAASNLVVERSAPAASAGSSPDAAGIGAMNLSELFIRRPVTTVLLNLASCWPG